MPYTAKYNQRSTELDIIRALKKFTYASCRQIADELNLTKQWTGNKLKLLKDARRIYIADWKKVKSAGDACHIYGLVVDPETDVDVPKPAPLSNTEKTTLYRRRKRLCNQLKLSTAQSSSTTQTA